MKCKVGICGAGAMGTGIAQVMATNGHKTIVYDSFPNAIEKSQQNIFSSLEKLVEKNKISAEDMASVKTNLKFTKNLTDFNDCDLVIEAIIEDIKAKKDLFEKLEQVVKPTCILASNTSSLSIASISSACKIQDRILGIHFFNPPTVMPLVEIIPGITTTNSIFKYSKQIVDDLGKITVVCKDTPGFIVNRIARSYYGESIRIHEESWHNLPEGREGLATIDWAMKTFGGFKMGPFELMDFIGNDVNFKVTESVWEQFFYDVRFKPSLTQKRLYEAGWLGRKTGKGYYDYSREMPQPVTDEKLGKEIFNRVIAMLINEAYDALYLKVASENDIEMAMLKGVNYPKGLIEWGKEIGVKNIINTLEQLQDFYKEDRYRVSPGLRKLI